MIIAQIFFMDVSKLSENENILHNQSSPFIDKCVLTINHQIGIMIVMQYGG